MQFRVQQLSFVPWLVGLCHDCEALNVKTKTELSARVVEANRIVSRRETPLPVLRDLSLNC